jgi:predicted hotdog family 3-hydroxylacyl-ACP dehydratase
VLIGRQRIGELIPHAGSMCLLDAVGSWDGDKIRCTATSHLDPANPLRGNHGLHAVCALEYAAQAMALHGALTAGHGQRSRGGLLASARDLVLHRARLDECGGELTIDARRVQGEASRVIYEFRVSDADAVIAEGRAAVVLDAGLS